MRFPQEGGEMPSDTEMPDKAKRPIISRIIDGERRQIELIDFEPVEEPWSVYRLRDPDGLVKIRIVVGDIGQLLDDDGEPVTDEAGEPILNVATTTIAGTQMFEPSK